MESNPKPGVRKEVASEIRHQYFSAAQARTRLGWEPLFTLKEWLRRTITWYQDFYSGSAVEKESLPWVLRRRAKQS